MINILYDDDDDDCCLKLPAKYTLCATLSNMYRVLIMQ